MLKSFNLSLNVVITSSIGFKLPLASNISAPKCENAFVSFSFPFVRFNNSPLAPDAAICSLVNEDRKAVPASLPLIPLLANKATKPAVSFTEIPSDLAIGAAYFNDSPKS